MDRRTRCEVGCPGLRNANVGGGAALPSNPSLAVPARLSVLLLGGVE